MSLQLFPFGMLNPVIQGVCVHWTRTGVIPSICDTSSVLATGVCLGNQQFGGICVIANPLPFLVPLSLLF